jgi:hypothetical protein
MDMEGNNDEEVREKGGGMEAFICIGVEFIGSGIR